MKLVYTPLNVSFLKTIENFMFLCFLLIYLIKNGACSGLLNKTKYHPHIFSNKLVWNPRAIFQPVTFMIRKILPNVGPKG